MSKKPAALRILDVTSIVLLLIATGMVFFYAPIEKVMGLVQKVFYFHVASTWMGMLGFLLSAVASIMYLRTKNLKWDAAAVSGTEIGMVFLLIGIITGSIWAKPIWNTWWTWDPRLTTTLIMELIYAAYFLFRANLGEIRQKARLSAIYNIVGFITVPITFLSIRIFRSIHPVIIHSASSSSGMFAMSDRMQVTFFASLAVFSLFFAVVFWHRYRLEIAQRSAENQVVEEE